MKTVTIDNRILAVYCACYCTVSKLDFVIHFQVTPTNLDQY